MHRIEEIPGAGQLLTADGQWPNFADYEVVDLMLTRRGKSWLTITNDSYDETGEWHASPLSCIRFEFSQILNLDLQGFCTQNVIGGLEILPVENRFRIKIWYCTGIFGELEVDGLSITVVERADTTDPIP